jgi:hypothetical protein
MAAEENNNTNTNTNNNTIATINWYDIINQDTRSLDDVYLGKVKGLYEPLIVIEKGTINKEKLYIPKSVIEKYSANILYLGITEQEAKNIYTRESPPSADEIKQIETITENRILASRRNNIETTEQQKAEVKKQRQHPKSEEEEIIKKLKQAASELKDLLISGAKVAKEKINEGKDITQEKIKEQREAAEERKAENDAKKISKMGDLALQFSTSFDDILSEISLTRTYAEQEQIYKGFIRLIQMQRKLLVARKELAAKLKGAVHEPILINNNDIKQPELTQDTQNQLNKASELPMPQPQLPKTISTAEEEEEEEIKSKPRIKMVTKKDSDIEVTRDEELPAMSSSSSSLSSNAATESPSTEIPSTEIPSTEIPSTEIYSTKREGKEGTTIEKRKLANEKRSSRNKSN